MMGFECDRIDADQISMDSSRINYGYSKLDIYNCNSNILLLKHVSDYLIILSKEFPYCNRRSFLPDSYYSMKYFI